MTETLTQLDEKQVAQPLTEHDRGDVTKTFEDALVENPNLAGEYTTPIPNLPEGLKLEDVIMYEKDGKHTWQQVRGALGENHIDYDQLDQCLPSGLNKTMVNQYYDHGRQTWMWQLRPSPELIEDDAARQQIEADIANSPLS